MGTKVQAGVVALVATVAVAAPASAGQGHEAELQFYGAEDQEGFVRLHGNVDTDTKEKCSYDRKVTVYRVSDGPDEKVVTTRTDSNSFWSAVILSPPEGVYYAKILKAKLGSAVCLSDKSEEIPFVR